MFLGLNFWSAHLKKYDAMVQESTTRVSTLRRLRRETFRRRRLIHPIAGCFSILIPKKTSKVNSYKNSDRVSGSIFEGDCCKNFCSCLSMSLQYIWPVWSGVIQWWPGVSFLCPMCLVRSYFQLSHRFGASFCILLHSHKLQEGTPN